MEEIAEICDEGRGYETECPNCGNIIYLEEDVDEDTINQITDGELVEIYCYHCDSYFKAELA